MLYLCLKNLLHSIVLVTEHVISQKKTTYFQVTSLNSVMKQVQNPCKSIFKRPARDACLCMGELPAPHFVFLITL